MKMVYAFLFLHAVTTSIAYATGQFPDKIVYNGKEYKLHTNPMEPYFKKHPDRRPKNGSRCTDLWRGYVATFEVKDNVLYLKNIEVRVTKKGADGEFHTTWKSVIDKFVPESKSLKVDWFTGILVLPHGKLVHYVHMGYGSIYSNYLLLDARKGRITRKRTLDGKSYAQFRERQYQAYKKTEAYRKEVETMKKKDCSQDFIDSFLRNFVVEYTSRFLEEKEPSRKENAPEKKDAPKRNETPKKTTEAGKK